MYRNSKLSPHSNYTTHEKCFSCKNHAGCTHSHGTYRFCEGCWNRYMKRKSGSELEGTDRTREVVRIRDGHRCQEYGGGCGRAWVHGERRFDVHHLNGNCGKMSYSYDRISNISGLITLCHRCHLNLPETLEKMNRRDGNVKTHSPKAWSRIMNWKKT